MKLKEKMKVRNMKGGDDDEEDEYVFTVKSMTQPKKVEVIVGGCVTENGDWFRGEHLCCRQILWSELKRQKIPCVSKKCDKGLYAYGNKEPLHKTCGHF